MPVWNVKKPDDFDRILDVQLERLQDDHIDFYLLHALDADHWQCVLEQGQLASAERALADGRIGHLGFSFHGLYEDFETILAATDLWEFCQIQFNYMDEELPGRPPRSRARGRQRPRRHRHGAGARRRLARNVPPQVAGRVGRGAGARSPAEWALQWVWSEPRGVLPAQRHEHHAARRGEPGVRRPLAARPADRRRARAGGARARPVPRAQPDPVHLVPLLHAVPAGRRHPRRLRALQRRPHVRRPRRAAAVPTRCSSTRASAPTSAPPAASAWTSARRASPSPAGWRRRRRFSPLSAAAPDGRAAGGPGSSARASALPGVCFARRRCVDREGAG